MKKLIFVLFISALPILNFGQSTKQDTAKKEYNNLIGIDATSLLRQFFNLSSGNYSYYYNPYMLTYKRFFHKNAIRFGIAGSYSNDVSKQEDTIENKNIYQSINIGLGYERNCSLSKRWSLYYGIDAITSYNYRYYMNNYSSLSYTQRTTIANSYGLSPLFGMIFRINSRITLSTETSLDIYYTKSRTKVTSYTNIYYNSDSENTSYDTQYNAPVGINFRVQF